MPTTCTQKDENESWAAAIQIQAYTHTHRHASNADKSIGCGYTRGTQRPRQHHQHTSLPAPLVFPRSLVAAEVHITPGQGPMLCIVLGRLQVAL